MKKVAVIFNGGTITMKIDPRIQAAVPTLKDEEIMGMVTGVERFAEIKAYNFSNLPGPHMNPNKMMELSRFVSNILSNEEICGVVITHGTDTLEETAYLLDLTLKSEKPVIMTGSMRNGSELGYDGPANLAASICTAISEKAKNRGVIVCLNDELNCASEVTKTHSMSLSTFKSPEFGPIGIVDNNRAIFYRDRTYMQHIDTEKLDTSVSLIKCCSGMDSRFVNFCIDQGDRGIVIEGFGRGNIPPDMVSGVDRATRLGIAIVLVSRCSEGRVLDSYGYHGGGKELRNLGVIFGENLPGQKARIKLMLALGKTKDLEEIRGIFEC